MTDLPTCSFSPVPRLLSLLAALGVGLAADAQSVSAPSTEMDFSNPIKLNISKTVLGGELPLVNKTLGLDDAIQIALNDNPTLEQSARSWTISKLLARSALAKFGPSASANLFYAKTNLNQTLFFMSDTPVASWPMQNTAPKGSLLSVVFAARQPLFTGGRLLGGYRAARAQERQSLAGFRENRVGTALQVRQAYWELVFQTARVKLNVDYVKYRQANANNIQAKVDTGKVPRADLLRETAELARAQSQLNLVYRDLNNAAINLKALLAVNFASEIAPKDRLEFIPVAHDLNYYLSEAGDKRPEIARARSFVDEMKSRRMVAASKYSPQVDLYGLGSSQTGHTPESPNANTNGRWGGLIGIIGGVTLFDSGSRFNELRAANEAIGSAQAAAKEAEIRVSKEVSQSWIDLELASKNIGLARTGVVSAEEDERLMHARYEVGKTIALEDFQASIRAFEAKLHELDAIYKYKLAEANLIAASGNL